MKSPLANVESRWATLIPAFSTSSQTFYQALEAAVAQRKIPDLTVSRKLHAEGAAFSAKREYLRLARGNLLFDICSAPFGSGHFFSWWLQRKTPRVLGLIIFLLVVTAGLVAYHWIGGPYDPVSAVGGGASTGILITLTVVAGMSAALLLARIGVFGPEGVVLAIPLLGWLYNLAFAPLTFHRLDTLAMFQRVVHGSVLEVIDSLTAEHGVRALADHERVPVMRELVGR